MPESDNKRYYRGMPRWEFVGKAIDDLAGNICWWFFVAYMVTGSVMDAAPWGVAYLVFRSGRWSNA